MGMSEHDWLLLLRDASLPFAWIVVILFILSGLDDLLYDGGAFFWLLYKRVRFSDRERLNVEKLHAREQQRIAIFLPAWQVSSTIGAMLTEILEHVDYRNFAVFVGTYPNDLHTQQAVDKLAALFPQVVKVVANCPSPSSHAHCLNSLYAAMQDYECLHEVNFDIVVLHRAGDIVHRHSLLLYNYLIPRVDVVQLPTLPAPTAAGWLAHQLIADEQAEYQMKEQLAREKMQGFITYTGSGTALSRRAMAMLEEADGTIFDETTVAEGYHLARKATEFGLKSIFVSIVLHERERHCCLPFSRRATFVANQTLYPGDVEQFLGWKSQQINAIALQYCASSGWQGSTGVKLNRLHDRKVAPATLLNLLMYPLGATAIICFHFHVLAEWGALSTLLLLSIALVCVRVGIRIGYVGMMYGPVAGLLAVPRMLMGNVLNGMAVMRALADKRKAELAATASAEEPVDLEFSSRIPPVIHSVKPPVAEVHPTCSLDRLLKLLRSADAGVNVTGLEAIPRELDAKTRRPLVQLISVISNSDVAYVRAAVARVSGFLQWPELSPLALKLLYDAQWVVRANAARALLKFPDFDRLVNDAFLQVDRYAWDVLIRSLEQDARAQQVLLPRLGLAEMSLARSIILRESPLLRHRYQDMLKTARPEHRLAMHGGR